MGQNGSSIIFFALMIVAFYFLLIRPQQKRQKAAQQLQSMLEVGDSVVTIGGLHGVINSIDEKLVVIKSTDGSLLTFDRYAIRESTKQSADTDKIE